MSDASWERVTAILDVVLVSEPGEWSTILDSRCGGDTELRASVESLLQRLDTARSYLSKPPAEAASALLNELHDTAESYEGRQVGAHRIVREIGRGGMARVFLAERVDGAFEQSVALKLLRPGLDFDLDYERFRAERQILATLNHPNIARLLDGGITQRGLPYLLLEYVDGMPIDQYCDAHDLTVARRIELFMGVVAATQYAHRNLIVHRDLKPSNILVTSDGQVKLLDFGLAKLLNPDGAALTPPVTQLGHRWMTPEYAAPEQVRGEPTSTLTDVYQLGAVFYHVLTGRLPFGRRGAHSRDLENAVLTDDAPPPSTVAPARARRELQGDVDAIVLKALNKEPERRYHSAAAMLEDLQRWRAGMPVEAQADSASYRLVKFVRRHRAAVAVAGIISVLLVGGGFRERTLRSRAEAEARKATAVGDYLRSVFNVADPYAPSDEGAANVTARSLLDRGAARIDSTLAGEPAVQSELRRLFGSVYSNLGLFDRAASELERALDQRRRLYGPRHPAVAEIMDGLGQVRASQGRLEEAEQLLRGALEQRRRLLGNRDTATASSADHLATLMVDLDRYDTAEPLYREALAIRRAQLGEASLPVASTYSNLGVLLYEKGQIDDAEAAYQQALAIHLKIFGEYHPETARTVHNLAQLEGLRGDNAAAERLFRRALAIKRRTLGDRHPSVTVNLNNLGEVIARSDNRLDEAEELLREALALDRQIFRAPHFYIAEDLRKLGAIMRRRGKFDEALSFTREALAMHTAVAGPHHTMIGLDLNIIGVVHNQLGQFREAIASERAALAQIEQVQGRQHLTYKVLSVNLARALRDAGEHAEAEQITSRMESQLDTAQTSERGTYINARVVRARALTGLGRAADARSLLEQIRPLAQAEFGADDWRTSELYLALAECDLVLGRRAQARQFIDRARSVVESQRHAQPVLTQQIERAARSL